MLNFLPQKNKNKIIYEYLLRVSILLSIFVFLSTLILISLFIPSFFYTKLKNDTINNQLQLTKQKSAIKGEDPALFIKNVNRLSVALSDNTAIKYSSVINKIVSLKNKDIKILSINITENESGGKKVLINGTANTRDSLTLFEKEIQTDGSFSTVVFPVSNFIQSTNSDFTASLTI